MLRFALAVCVALVTLAATPTPASARVFIGFGGGWCCGYAPYYSPYYYGYPTYYAPPPPTVVYQAPAPVTYVQPQPQTVYVQPQSTAQPLPASEASETFTDSSGRTCRNFQSTLNNAPVSGTACLQPDGSWRTVGP